MRYEFVTTVQMKAYSIAWVLNKQGRVVKVLLPSGKVVVPNVGNTGFGIISNKCW